MKQMKRRHLARRRPSFAGDGLEARSPIFSWLCGLVLLFACSLMYAADPPHWTSVTVPQDCTTSCHISHQGTGGTLTQSASNVNLCQSCHNTLGQAGDLPIGNNDIAVPGQKGTSHAFDVSAVNAGFGTQLPTDAQMQLRVIGSNIVCSTCHDQHAAVSTLGGTPRTSGAKKITALGSTGILSSGGTYTGAQGSWYLVEIQIAGNETTAQFRYSKDNGSSWMASNLVAGPSVVLDNGVTVSFGVGSYNVGERWQFYASWPFLRATYDSGTNGAGSKFCRDCHNAWTMDHTAVETYDGSSKSHPVGVTLNANGLSYDRAVPLDGNGAAQGGAGVDSNPTNDLKLDAGNLLQCWTCHNPHFADSNTQTKDGP